MPSVSHSAISLWDKTAPPAPKLEPLQGDADADVVIIGGGFTGCSAALHLAKSGIQAILLEVEKIGYGGSGRNVGLVNAGVWLPPQLVIERLGAQHGQRLVERLGEGPGLVFALIDQYRIECEARHNGTIHVAHSNAGYKDLSQRAEQWRALRAPVELLDKKTTESRLRSNAFYGGLLDRRAGTVNPMGYVRGLAHAAVNTGARLHVNTPVTKLARNGDGWTATTANGSIHAQYVIIATNAYADDVWPELWRTFTPIQFFQIASKPLGESANQIVPGREGLWDTAPIMSSIRIDAHGRLILGSMGKIMGVDATLTRRWANRNIQRIFPQLGHVEWDHWWQGTIALTSTHIPFIYNPAPNLYCPSGYNGRGIAPGTVFGKAIAEFIATGDEKVLPLPLSQPSPVAFRMLKATALDTAFKTHQIFRSIY